MWVPAIDILVRFMRTKAYALTLGLVLTFLLLPVASFAQPATQHGAYFMRYDHQEVRYYTITTPLSSAFTYIVIKGEARGTVSNQTLTLTTQTYLAAALSAPPTSVTIDVSSSYLAAQEQLYVSLQGDGGTLLTVSVVQDGVAQIVWAGVQQLSGSFGVNGTAYVNSSQPADIELGFASQQGVIQLSAPLGGSVSISATLPEIGFTLSAQSTTTAYSGLRVPTPYQPYPLNEVWVNGSVAATAPMTGVAVSSFSGANFPSMVWSINGTTGINVKGRVYSANYSARVSEFFGVNGTPVGYALTSSMFLNHSISTAALTADYQAYGSLIIVARSPTILPQSVSGHVETYKFSVSGKSVVLVVNTSLKAETSAKVDSEHRVYAEGQALLLYVNVSGNNVYLLVNPSRNLSTLVAQAAAHSEGALNITVNHYVYTAIKIVVNVTGYTVFNFSVPYSNVVVYKQTSSGLVALNTSDYWQSSGRLYVLDDPSNIYYVANAASAKPVATTMTTPTVSPSTKQVVTSTLPTNDTTWIIVVVVVILLVVVGLLLAFRRR
jgi:hypothetical protein